VRVAADTAAVGLAGISGRYGIVYRSESVNGRIRKKQTDRDPADPMPTDRAPLLYRPDPIPALSRSVHAMADVEPGRYSGGARSAGVGSAWSVSVELSVSFYLSIPTDTTRRIDRLYPPSRLSSVSAAAPVGLPSL
jgi:hypothetical protein